LQYSGSDLLGLGKECARTEKKPVLFTVKLIGDIHEEFSGSIATWLFPSSGA
jgi:hypothetical protein